MQECRLDWEWYNPDRPVVKTAELNNSTKLVLTRIDAYDEWELDIQANFSCWSENRRFTLDIDTTDWAAAQAKAELAAKAYFDEIAEAIADILKRFA